MNESSNELVDLFIIGGGVNGCGIARDAAGRGLSVILCEQGDLAEATSSASTKLFHGGLRYLEYFEFRLVREALMEREVLLKAMPHISWPLRFVLPLDPDVRYPNDHTKLGQLLRFTMPFLRGRRPSWLIRVGLFIYDNLGGRHILPPTKTIDLSKSPVGAPLKKSFRRAFEYSDCWVEDSRLVVLNARDAAARGAVIWTRTRFMSARRVGEIWQIELQNIETGETRSVTAKGIVNAGGPWVEEVLNGRLGQNGENRVRLVRGSHIVVHRLFEHNQPYFLQLADGRVIFAIPYENDYTLIGTTDHDHEGDPGEVECTPAERDYLLAAANRFFEKQLTVADIAWTYSGVRPLFNDNATNATSTTRDYVLTMSDVNGAAPLLSVFGGKITTFRKLAEEALRRLADFYPAMSDDWTAGVPLPGGDFPVDGVSAVQKKLQSAYPFLTSSWSLRLVRAYGLDAFELLGEAVNENDLGTDFGATLTQREVDWLIDMEWARSAEDIVWRRTKLGLRLSVEQISTLEKYTARQSGRAASAEQAANG